MNNNEIVICVEKGNDAESASALADKLNIPVVDAPGEGLTLLYGNGCVSLVGYGMTYTGDFLQMLRRTENGMIRHEMLVRAAKTKKENPTLLDAAAGMGEDAFILAASGFNVTLYEKNPIIAELLRDAVRRAKKLPELAPTVDRMNVIEGNSILDLETVKTADVVYLDPMFPERRKSGLIGKKLQLIQKLESPCDDELELFNSAIRRSPEKIVVKRPQKGPYLAGKRPSYTLNGKAIRYDCYVL